MVIEMGPGTVVTREQLEALAAELPASRAEPAARSAPTRQLSGKFDLDAFMAEHLPQARGPEPWGDARKWVLPVCPWNPQHANAAAFVVQQPNGAIGAGCHHDGCSGNGWPELRTLFDRRYAARKASEDRLREMPAHVAAQWRERPAEEESVTGDFRPPRR